MLPPLAMAPPAGTATRGGDRKALLSQEDLQNMANGSVGFENIILSLSNVCSMASQFGKAQRLRFPVTRAFVEAKRPIALRLCLDGKEKVNESRGGDFFLDLPMILLFLC